MNAPLSSLTAMPPAIGRRPFKAIATVVAASRRSSPAPTQAVHGQCCLKSEQEDRGHLADEMNYEREPTTCSLHR